MQIRHGMAALGILALGAAIGAAGFSAARAQAQQVGPDGNALAAGLIQTDGCLGVEFGGLSSGKRCIIAWFDSKDAVVRWYHSEAHQGVMKAFITDAEFDRAGPLAHVPDDVGPIMVMATLTPSDGENVQGMSMSISQISIELYKPLPGGAFVIGRLAPEGFNVPHMKDYTPAGD